jgi:hypothetical protein
MLKKRGTYKRLTSICLPFHNTQNRILQSSPTMPGKEQEMKSDRHRGKRSKNEMETLEGFQQRKTVT